MRIGTRRVEQLKVRIQEIEEDIKKATDAGRPAFAQRLLLIKEKEQSKLINWTWHLYELKES